MLLWTTGLAGQLKMQVLHSDSTLWERWPHFRDLLPALHLLPRDNHHFAQMPIQGQQGLSRFVLSVVYKDRRPPAAFNHSFENYAINRRQNGRPGLGVDVQALMALRTGATASAKSAVVVRDDHRSFLGYDDGNLVGWGFFTPRMHSTILPFSGQRLDCFGAVKHWNPAACQQCCNQQQKQSVLQRSLSFHRFL